MGNEKPERFLFKNLLNFVGVFCFVFLILLVLFASANKQLSRLRPEDQKKHAAALKRENLLGNPDFATENKMRTAIPDMWNLHLVDGDAGKKISIRITPPSVPNDCAVATLTNDSNVEAVFYT
jgi:hypothetical protein